MAIEAALRFLAAERLTPARSAGLALGFAGVVVVIGPDLPDGRQSLVLVSDNNFAPSQFTQFLLFALSRK